MFTTPNMSLVAWDQGLDDYDWDQLANNWVAVDQHDHSTGRGAKIPSGGIQDNAIITTKIQDGSVVQSKLADNSVGGPQIINNSVGTAEIADGAVTTPKIANGAVTSQKLDPNFLPLGTVIAWYRPSSTVTLPTGWEVADGRSWATVTNDWGVSTGNMPDLRNKFILGAATTGTGTIPSTPPDIGVAGGAHTRALSHTHTTQGHAHAHNHFVNNHSHTIGPHQHTVPHSHTVNPHSHGISPAGAHNHGLSWRYNLTEVVDHQTSSGSARYQTLWSSDMPQDGSGSGSLGGVSDHSHGGATATAGATTTTDAPLTSVNSSYESGLTSSSTSIDSTPATVVVDAGDASSSNAGDFRPAYVGLLYLLKVRL